MKCIHNSGSPKMSRFIPALAMMVLFLFISVSVSLAQIDAALLYLKISPYARANGMGQAFVALSDQESPYYNPAGLAIFALNHHGSITFFPKSFHWLPAFTNDLELKHGAIQLGYNLKKTKYNRPFSVSLGYYYTKMEYGSQVRYSQTGDVIETYETYDRANNFVFSIAYDSPIDVGLGVTYKYLDSKLGSTGAGAEASTRDESAYAFDFGAIVRAPLIDLLLPSLQSSSGFSVNVDPSIGICWSNVGPGICYIGCNTVFSCDNKDPLPKTFIYGAALQMGISYEKRGIAWNLLTLTGSLQYDKNLAGGEHYIIKKRGAEFGIGDIFSYRKGSWKDKYFHAGEHEWVPTNGYGYSVKGVIKIVSLLSGYTGRGTTNIKGKLIHFVNEHLDIRYECAKYEAGGTPLQGFEGYSMSIIF